MNPYEMAAFIVLVVTVGSVLRAAFGGRSRRRDRDRDAIVKDDAETVRLRDEVRQLKERLQVIERITVEKESSLEREIERLRDRP
jgi:uncharacterized protein YlxW (UPF0749 family)